MKHIQNSIVCAIAGVALFGTAASATPAVDGNAGPFAVLGTPVPVAQLKAARARGEIVVSAASNGSVGNNAVNGSSVTGTITDSQSIQSNSGFTTVLQNTGNNALLQNSTSIYVSVK